MKNFLFCARNIEDYLTPLDDATEEAIVDWKNKDLLATADVQNLFRSILKSHVDEKNLEAPISDEIETGLQGVKLDFNFGLRLEVPAGNWRVRISDFDSGIVCFDRKISDMRLTSLEKYYIRWQVEFFLDGEKVFTHTLDLADRPVLIYIPKIGLGDTISILPNLREFKRRHKCKLKVVVPERLRELTAHLYPEIEQADELTFNQYAMYHLFIPFNLLPVWPIDTRISPLGQTSSVALGLGTIAPKPNFEPTMPPVTNDPYVCIAAQASTPRKGWLYPDGWNIVIDYLKSLGYRVFCIDRDRVCTDDKIGLTTYVPTTAEDFTGEHPIMERANMLYYAEFFIGLGSGLSWLADAVHCPVVMIAGFSQDWAEFYTPYRVANRLVCNGCFNDVRVSFMKDTCPYHAGTPRELECQKKISPRQVIDAIERLIMDEHLTPPVLGVRG